MLHHNERTFLNRGRRVLERLGTVFLAGVWLGVAPSAGPHLHGALGGEDDARSLLSSPLLQDLGGLAGSPWW